MGVVVWLAALGYFLDGQPNKGIGGILLGLIFFFVAGWVTWRLGDGRTP